MMRAAEAKNIGKGIHFNMALKKKREKKKKKSKQKNIGMCHKL